LIVQNLNVGGPQEVVTFEIVPANEVQRPGFLRLLLQVVRFKYLILSLAPLLCAWILSRFYFASFDRLAAIVAVIGVCLFHLALNLFDDYFDHMRGRDRLNTYTGSRAIQKGWIRAISALRLAWILTVLAAACGAFIATHTQSPGLSVVVLVIASLALVLGLGFTFGLANLRLRGQSELINFILAGPLLTVGFSWAILGGFDWSFLLLGFVFGFSAVIYDHLKNIENIMLDAQAGDRNLAVRLGFDRAKTALWLMAAGSSLSILFLDWSLEADGVLVPAFFVHAGLLIPLFRKLERTASPLSSELNVLRQSGLRAYLVTALALGFLLVVQFARLNGLFEK